MKKLVIGILAHVDAGKTTLAEGILFECNKVRKLGRVDHGDTVLDHYAIERKRGITVFSKQANVSFDDLEITLLDTPGHVDFSVETERTLSVLDAAILVISGVDGVQSHTLTLWRLLKQYKVPVFLFMNKMDMAGADRDRNLSELRNKLDASVVLFPTGPEADPHQPALDGFADELSMCNEEMMEAYLEGETIRQEMIVRAIGRREVFPLFCGAALKLEGVAELLKGIRDYAPIPFYPAAFGARVFKIVRDGNTRLTYVKITGGQLKVKENLTYTVEDVEYTDKVDQIRVYDGTDYKTKDVALAGEVVSLVGLEHTISGLGLGHEQSVVKTTLAPVLTYRVVLPVGTDPFQALDIFRKLYEEIPEMNVTWKESLKQIHVQVMGDIQIDIIKELVKSRFHMEVEFENGSIVYKETIATPAIGIGHYEPLKHYAEVQLLLVPAPRGSGLHFVCNLPTDDLDLNWQRLIMTHLCEKAHEGVLGGFAITDMEIRLLAGRAHLKHTEGGDFRQATYRAIRQGLMQCESHLLEPYYAYELLIPTTELGRAMTDIKKMSGEFEGPETLGEMSRLTGICPVYSMRNYQREVNAYTHGYGSLILRQAGYYPCHNEEEVLESLAYDPDGDLDNPSSSVFCSHGAGVLIPWYEVAELAHLNVELSGADEEDFNREEEELMLAAEAKKKVAESRGASRMISQEEIEKIYAGTYRQSKEDLLPYRNGPDQKVNVVSSGKKEKPYVYKPVDRKDEYLFVDGYNVIFAADELRELSRINIDSARDALADKCCNYQGSRGCNLILVFDAYKVKSNPGKVIQYHNITIVYTKENEIADAYIEREVSKLSKKASVSVATSDGLEQNIIWGLGANRISARQFWADCNKEFSMPEK